MGDRPITEKWQLYHLPPTNYRELQREVTMKNIQLTQGKVAVVDDEDFERLNKHKWCAHKERGRTYALRHGRDSDGNRIMIQMHREVMNTPDNLLTDHRNFDGLNNQRYNLRMCTSQENMRHTRKRAGCSSIFKGVTWHTMLQKWRAYINLDKKQIALGCYISEIDAAFAYNKAASILFGEFAELNLIGKDYPLPTMSEGSYHTPHTLI